MSDPRVRRQLSAILAMDVVGYSRLMGADEEGTLARLKERVIGLVEPKIAEHEGRVFKTTGDGMLVEFGSVVEAVRSAVAIQAGMAEKNAGVGADRQMEFRMGIHVSDVIIDGSDVFGDGVNIAARLEGIAEPGGIAVSARVREDAEGRLDVSFEDRGEHELKNIARSLRVYRVHTGKAPAAPALPALPDKPSIAVLAFENMSGESDQEYFAEGIAEEIITALSRMSWLFVIARNSSFTYKGRAVDVKQIARELGVRYVLEGSVRRATDKVRISGQLIDAASGGTLWADRFDGALADVFELQDQVTGNVIAAIAPKLEQAEIERARRKPTESLSAYDTYLRGLASAHRLTKTDNDEALRHFLRAAELDPQFASAFGMAAWCYVFRKANGWMADREAEVREAERLARRAIALGRDDAVALSRGGHALAFVCGDLEGGAANIERALALNPNLSSAWLFGGWVQDALGNPDVAIERLERTMRMSPRDPLMFGIENGIAFAHFLARRYDEAAAWAEKSLRESPDYLPSLRFAAASHALSGRLDQARSIVRRIRKLDPGLRCSNLGDAVALRSEDDLARLADGLRQAGLPD